MQQLFLVFTLVFSFSALANFSGDWQGEGMMTYKDETVQCEEVYFTLTQTETELGQDQGGFRCGEMSATWEKSTTKIQNGQLILDGKVIGHINTGEIYAHMKEQKDGEDRAFTVHVIMTGPNKLTVNETYVVNGVLLYRMIADLER